QNDTIGVIKINSVGTDTFALVEKAITEFKLKNVKGIVVDLRNNPGGYLDGAVKVSGNWLKKGQVIVEEKRDDKVVESFKATKDGTLLGVPTVVLINEGSASASEIMAGALRDNGAATLVGVTTYGKGSVQEVVQFDDGGALKVTVARWYTPSGKNINKDGIAPDQKIELTEENFKNKQDSQFDAAIQKLTSQP
ncbi:MAG: carboxyl-terminal processing protease, partial [Patescibacteria group bacterium]|nr:carboxyl-terminal processing protease [Patescibacteria group bacterium]